LERRALVLVIETRAGNQIEAIAERDRALTEDADAEIVERRARRMLAHREWRDDERREAVDRILFVVLCEKEHAALPTETSCIGEPDRRPISRGKASLLGELEVFLVVVARRDRQRGVIEIGGVLRLPVQEPGRARERHRTLGPPHENRCAEDV